MAQRQFLQLYAPAVFALIARLTPNSLDAEELTQDSLLRAIVHIDSYDPALASLSTWINRIAYRTALNNLRNHPRPILSLDNNPDISLQADEKTVQDFLQNSDDSMTELLRQAIDYLPPDEQTLLNLFYFDDLPLKDIAFIMEAPPGTLATRLHRIRKKLYSLILTLQQQ
jgi:RNA polymerase sigma-70 factor (ECF subfamily)